jgi:hypothetical protein
MQKIISIIYIIFMARLDAANFDVSKKSHLIIKIGQYLIF